MSRSGWEISLLLLGGNLAGRSMTCFLQKEPIELWGTYWNHWLPWATRNWTTPSPSRNHSVFLRLMLAEAKSRANAAPS